MNQSEKDYIEKREMEGLLHRLDVALYACSIVIEGKQSTPMELILSERIEFPSSRFFVESMLDAGCLTTRKILQFFGIGVTNAKLSLHKGRNTDIKITDWTGGALLDVTTACEILEPDFKPDEIEQCLRTVHVMADKSIAHFTVETVSQNRQNIFALGIAFFAARKLADKYFYALLLKQEAPKIWLPPGFNFPGNRPPWKIKKTS